MTGFSSHDPIFASDHTYRREPIPPLRRFIPTAPETFQALGTPLAAGRDYDWTDIHQKREVVLISEGFARENWGTAAAAIGKRIRSNPNDEWSEIIGVVADIRHDGVDRPSPSTVYWPLRRRQVGDLHPPRPARWHRELATDIRRAVAATSAACRSRRCRRCSRSTTSRWRGRPSR